MQTRTVARVFGIIYVVIGILGFIPGILQAAPPDAPHLSLAAAYGRLLGLFPVNVLHDLVHIAVGAWGIAAAASLVRARAFFKAIAIIFAVLTILGLIGATNTVFGLVPLYSHDIWLHALTAILGAYFGYAAPAGEEARVTSR